MEFTDKTQEYLSAAVQLAKESGHIDLRPAHLGLALFEDNDGLAVQVAKRCGADLQQIRRGLRSLMLKTPAQDPPPHDIYPNRALSQWLNESKKKMTELGDSFIAVDHLLLTIYGIAELAPILGNAGLSKNDLEDTVKQLKGSRKTTTRSAEETYNALEKFGTDLVALAEEGKLDPVIGRDDEIRRVILVLARRTKNNPILIGQPGVGKTAIIEGLAQRIVRGDVPDTISDARLVSLDMGSLVSGAKYQGEFEERLKSVLKEIEESKRKVILFIDEIHLVVGAGKTSGSMDAANLLKPMLARGQLHCIGATTLNEYRQHIEKDPAFERRFQQVYVNEPDVPSTISILRGLKEKYQAHHGVTVTDSALVAAATLSTRYISGRFQPDKSIDLVDEACAQLSVQLESRPEVIDQLERRKMQLEIEQKALEKESDKLSKQRLKNVKEEIKALSTQLAPLVEEYESEKNRVEDIKRLREKRDQLKAKIEAAMRMNDVATASDLKYYALPDVEKKLHQLEEQEERRKNQMDTSDKAGMVIDTVGPQQIAEVVSRWTGIPVAKLTETQREKLLTLEDNLHERVVGQDAAVTAVSDAVLRAMSGMGRPGQPQGSFLFLGPTGVGKTELAKALAYQLFDDENHIARFDMSEYMEQHSVARLIGAPPGYVGYDQGGQLTEVVRQRPYQVVLLDEIEKAHPRVLNVLLQVLDDGRLTDGQGRVVDFSNTIIILTSNIGDKHLLAAAATGDDPQAESRVMAQVRAYLKPELINRLDDIIIFKPLTRENLHQITRLLVRKVSERLSDKNITLELTEEALDYVLEHSYNPVYGARPVRRWVEKNIVTQLSVLIISGQLHENSTVTVSVRDGELHYVTSAERMDAD